jgi:PPOX class probable F420-dependent enzyme
MLTPAQHEFLLGRHYAVVGTLNADNTVQQTLIWYIFEEGMIRFGLGANSIKAKNIRRTGQLTCTIHADGHYLTLSGPATVEPPDLELRRRVAARYLPADQLDAWLARPIAAERASVRMQIARVYGQGV